MSEQTNKTNEQSQTQSPTPSAEHERLNIFVGKWKAEGKSYGPPDNPHESGVEWIGEENYEWFPGEFFLIHRFDNVVGGEDFIGIEVIGYDTESQSYFTRFFDNSGNHPEYRLSASGNTWTWTGEAQRSKIEFGDDGETMRTRWEFKNEGADWQQLCDVKAVKSK